ncbi:putative nuclease HARBI1 [Rhopilema esculentum]|uniref:putative nuclease HARBI1 n=1 Tax=Rhopilema esculentum TaxID=499914 RepID=UPI0031E172A3
MAPFTRKQLIAVIGAVYVLRAKRKRHERNQKRKHKFWIRKIFKAKESSEYYSLYQELRMADREYHFRYLRISLERFDHLHSLLEKEIKKKDTHFRKAISTREKLVLTLRYLATGCPQQNLSYSFRVGRATVSNIVRETADAIYKVLSPIYLRPPQKTEDWEHISQDFEKLWNMPHVIGAIDGKHIAIDCPKNSGSQDHNYKGFFSISLLAICDARYNFTIFDVGQHGSNNDSGVLLNSEMGQRFEEGSLGIPQATGVNGYTLGPMPYYLVGDEIFPLKDWLMRPYPGSLNEDQRIFNYRLSRARRVIENTFGIMVARWRLFRGPIRASRENVVRYVLAAVCLHNYLRQTENAVYCPNGFVDSEDSSGQILPGEWRRLASDGMGLQNIQRVRGSRHTANATAIRNALKQYLCSEAGSVPWQLAYIQRTGDK